MEPKTAPRKGMEAPRWMLGLCLMLSACLITPLDPCEDADGDGYGRHCSLEDCDDDDASVHPGAAERCDGVDQDCDGQIDEGLQTKPWYADTDGDGYGNPAVSEPRCGPTAGWASNPDDCDDEASDVYPGALELCDLKRQDCDRAIDEQCTALVTVWVGTADGNFQILRSDTEELLAAGTVGAGPTLLASANDGTVMATADGATAFIELYDYNDFEPSTSYAGRDGCGSPTELAVEDDRLSLYLACADSFAELALRGGGVITTVDVPASSLALFPARHPDLVWALGDTLSACEQSDPTEFLSLDEPVGSLSAMAYDSNRDTLMVADEASGTVYVLDAEGFVLLHSWSVPGHPSDLAYDHVRDRLYVADQIDTVWALEPWTGETLAVIDGLSVPTHMELTTAADALWLTEAGSEALSLIDPASFELVSSRPLSDTPSDLALLEPTVFLGECECDSYVRGAAAACACSGFQLWDTGELLITGFQVVAVQGDAAGASIRVDGHWRCDAVLGEVEVSYRPRGVTSDASCGDEGVTCTILDEPLTLGPSRLDGVEPASAAPNEQLQLSFLGCNLCSGTGEVVTHISDVTTEAPTCSEVGDRIEVSAWVGGWARSGDVVDCAVAWDWGYSCDDDEKSCLEQCFTVE
jgi:hypothetical protein